MKWVAGILATAAIFSQIFAYANEVTVFSAAEVADVMECAYSDKANLSVLGSLNAKPSKAQKKLSKRLAKLDDFLAERSENEVHLGEVEVEARRAKRKEERASMSAIDLAVSSARSKPPCGAAERALEKGAQ